MEHRIWAPPKSVQRLHEALLELIEQKDYDLITIKDITDIANISRRTFYLHYENKEQLLNEIYWNFIEWTLRPFRDTCAINEHTGKSDLFLKLTNFITVIKDNKRTVRCLFDGERKYLALSIIISIFLAERTFSQMNGSFFLHHFDDPKKQYYYTEMICQNCISGICFILNNIDRPSEELAREINEVFQIMGQFYISTEFN